LKPESKHAAAISQLGIWLEMVLKPNGLDELAKSVVESIKVLRAAGKVSSEQSAVSREEVPEKEYLPEGKMLFKDEKERKDWGEA
jgi:hypothetical protein